MRVRGRGLPDECLQLTEDTGTLLSLCVWFIFGAAVNDVLDTGIPLDAILYAVVALTVVRIVPVMLALLASGLFLLWQGRRTALRAADDYPPGKHASPTPG